MVRFLTFALLSTLVGFTASLFIGGVLAATGADAAAGRLTGNA